MQRRMKVGDLQIRASASTKQRYARYNAVAHTTGHQLLDSFDAIELHHRRINKSILFAPLVDYFPAVCRSIQK